MTNMNPENQRIAITYLEAIYEGDEAKIASVREVISDSDLISELSRVSLILAVHHSLLLDPVDPRGPEAILEKIRDLSFT